MVYFDQIAVLFEDLLCCYSEWSMLGCDL